MVCARGCIIFALWCVVNFIHVGHNQVDADLTIEKWYSKLDSFLTPFRLQIFSKFRVNKPHNLIDSCRSENVGIWNVQLWNLFDIIQFIIFIETWSSFCRAFNYHFHYHEATFWVELLTHAHASFSKSKLYISSSHCCFATP